MNRTELVHAIARKEGLTQAQVARALHGFMEVVAMNMAVGERVTLRDFGRFEPRERKPMTRKNPVTGIPHDSGPRNSVGFVPSSVLKDRLNNRAQ